MISKNNLSHRNILKYCLLAVLCALISVSGFTLLPAQAQSNPIQTENQLAGTTAWLITNPANNSEISGYAHATSIDAGEDLDLYISSTSSSFTLTVYRLGWYNGSGARQILTPVTVSGQQQSVPSPNGSTGLLDLDWIKTYTVSTGSDWVTGSYLIKLINNSGGKQAYIPFTVRDDDRPADLVFQHSVTTWQAYNNFGGKSLYDFNSSGNQANVVSFNRPYAGDFGSGELLKWEYQMIRWLEKEGYDVTYITNLDTHISADHLKQHKAFLSVGHDEYWSWDMRDHVEEAMADGVDLGFFTADAANWQVRFEPSAHAGGAVRNMVGYRTQSSNDPILSDGDSSNDYLVSGAFRASPTNRPEEALIGMMYGLYPVDDEDMIVQNTNHWVFDNTTLQDGDVIPNILGYEVDGFYGSQPNNLEILAATPLQHPTNSSRDLTTYMTIYDTGFNSNVFATGTIQWSWGLDNFVKPYSGSRNFQNANVEQITRNVLDEFISSPNVPPTPTPLPTETPVPAPDDWTFNNQSGAYVAGSDSQIQVTGTGSNYAASFLRKDGSTFGSGNRVTFDFYVNQKDSKSHLSIIKQGGNYERLAILDRWGGLYVQLYRPNSAEPAIIYPLLSNSDFQANTWYSGSITIDDQYGFFVDVEQRDNPAVQGSFRDSNNLFTSGSTWQFFGFLYDHSVFLDNYLEESVTLVPPAPDEWIFNNNTGSYVTGSETQIQSNGTGSNYAASFLRKDGNTFGSGNKISFDFYVDQKDSKSHLSIIKQGGNYERLAILDRWGGLYVQLYRPNSVEPAIIYPLLSNSDFQANTWYSGSITIDDQYGFFVDVEQRDNPAVQGSFRDSNNLFTSGSTWQFFGFLYDHSVFLDNYLEESVTLVPPAPDEWIFNNNTGSYVAGSETQIQSSGTGSNWLAKFWRKDESTFGSGNKVSFDFYVDQKDSKSHLSIIKQGGDYERLAILDRWGGLYVQLYRPNSAEPAIIYPLLSNSDFQANTWYSGTITVDDINGFLIEVTQKDTPSVNGSYQDSAGLLALESEWKFFGLIYENTVFLDNYSEEVVP